MTTSPTSATAAVAVLPERGRDGLPARFALTLRPDQSPPAVAAEASALLADFEVEVAPISPTVHSELVVTLGAKTLDGADPAAAFEAGYALADELGVSTAEPDLPTPFFPEEDPPADGESVLERLGFPGCWVDPEPGLSDGWAPDKIKAPAAWALSEAGGRPAKGLGVVIAQPDTGLVPHTELAGVTWVAPYDVLGQDPDPTDPLDGRNPGHGTAMASVVVSPELPRVVGSAPAAQHMPIRAITSVISVRQVAVAQAIDYAVDHGAHVITMSLGGLPADVLERAVRRAVAADVLVLAAAGNCVRFVVYPARYDDCLAVAGTDASDRPWRGSCRGAAVDISAPGQNVYKALAAGGDAVGQGQGTSFAVALTAGVAALWLAHHGRANLIATARAQGETLQAMFRRLVRATARRPSGWDSSDFGAGIVDAATLLAANLDLGLDTKSVAPPATVVFDTQVAAMVAEAVGPEAALDPGLDWARYGPELAYALLDAQLRAPADADGPSAGTPIRRVSDALSQAVGNPLLRDWLGLDGRSGQEVGGE